MPYAFTWEPNVATARFWGSVTAAEFLEGAMMVSGDERFDGLQFIVNNFLGIENHDIDTDEVMERLASNSIGAAQTNSNIRVVVVTTDERITSMAKEMNEHPYASGHEIRVFRTLAQAREWMVMQPLRIHTRSPRFE